MAHSQNIMGSRNRIGRHPDNYREFREMARPPLPNRGPGPLPVHPAILEEELELQHREMQRLIADNRGIIDDNTHLQREVTSAKDEIHRLSQQVIPKVGAEKEAQTRDLIDKKMKLESELRALEPTRKEVGQLRSDVKQLNSLRLDLSSQVQGLTKDVTRLQAENQQIIAMKADIDGLRSDLYEARRALDYEKKAREEQDEQKDAMEKNLASMAHEIEKLRAEQTDRRRTRGVGGGGYGMVKENPEMRYQAAHRYGDGYAGGGWGHYDSTRGDPPRR